MKALLVGLGKAAWLNDLGKPGKRTTHTSSLLDLNDFFIAGGVDSKFEPSREWSRAFDKPVFMNLEEAISRINPDLIVIAVPMDQLANCLTLVLRVSNALIVIEKPVVVNILEWNQLHANLLPSSRVLVNLPRLFAAETMILLEILRRHTDTKMIISGTYSGMTLNTSLHFISLFNHFFANLNWQKVNKDNYSNYIFQNESKSIAGSFVHNPKVDSSSFDFKIQNENLEIEYISGGEKISCKEFGVPIKIESTRSVYQKNVYEHLMNDGEDASIKIAGLKVIKKSILDMLGE